MGSNKMRILLLAYYFPPLGGPASIRLGKLVKYLRRLGWEIDVISVRNILYYAYDNDLEKECQPDTIKRTISGEILTLLYYLGKLRQRKPVNPSDKRKDQQTENFPQKIYFFFSDSIRNFFKNLLPPDEKIGWLPFACSYGKKMLRSKKYDYILTSIGPFTSAMIAYKLSKMSNVPLILDYRDHWTMHPYSRFLSPWHRKISRKWEEEVLRHATLITTAGKVMRSELMTGFQVSDPHKLLTIYNGYDEDDFPVPAESTPLDIRSSQEGQKEDRNILFTYTGSLYPPITPMYFLSALKELKKRSELPIDLQVRFIGNYHRDMYSLLSDPVLKDTITIIPSLPHRESIKEMLRSDVLLLFLSSREGKGILTSKAFEYLRSGRPILAMIPANAEIAPHIATNKQNILCPMEDVQQISSSLLQMYQAVANNISSFSNDTQISEFSREKQIQKLDQILRERSNSLV